MVDIVVDKTPEELVKMATQIIVEFLHAVAQVKGEQDLDESIKKAREFLKLAGEQGWQ